MMKRVMMCIAALVLLLSLAGGALRQGSIDDWENDLEGEEEYEISEARREIPSGLFRTSATTGDVAAAFGIPNASFLVRPWEAQAVAERYAGALPEFQAHRDAGLCITCNAPYAIVMNDRLLGYVFDSAVASVGSSPMFRGFLALSGSTNVQPLIAYSGSGSFPWEATANNFLLNAMIRDLGSRLEADQAGAGNCTRFQRNRDLWEYLITSRYAAVGVPVAYASLNGDSEARAELFADRLIQWPANWVQNFPPFNGMTPGTEASPNAHSQVGCVALALAQVLFYHDERDQFLTVSQMLPNGAVFSFPDPTEDPGYVRIEHALNEGPDDDRYDDTVRKLCYTAGLSVGMKYGLGTSYAFVEDLIPALCQTWSMHAELVANGNDSEGFFKALRNEIINKSRPLILRMEGDGVVPHAVVCDGIREPLDGGAVEYHLRTGFMPASDMDACWECAEDWVGPIFSTSSPRPDYWEGSTWYSLPDSDYPSHYNTVTTAIVGLEPHNSGESVDCPEIAVRDLAEGPAGAGSPGGGRPYPVELEIDGPADVTFGHFFKEPFSGLEKTGSHSRVLQEGPVTRQFYVTIPSRAGVHTFGALIERDGETDVATSQMETAPGLADLAWVTPVRGPDCAYEVGERLTADYYIAPEAGNVRHVALLTLDPEAPYGEVFWPEPATTGADVFVSHVRPGNPGERLLVLLAVTNAGVLTAYETFQVAE